MRVSATVCSSLVSTSFGRVIRENIIFSSRGSALQLHCCRTAANNLPIRPRFVVIIILRPVSLFLSLGGNEHGKLEDVRAGVFFLLTIIQGPVKLIGVVVVGLPHCRVRALFPAVEVSELVLKT